MASRRSRQKSASAPDASVLERLLQDGAVFEAPEPNLIAAADHLVELGLIHARKGEFVLCANPRDADFRHRQSRCPGRIWLYEGGDSYHCPECDRLLFPVDTGKRRYAGLQVWLRPDGITTYLTRLSADLGEPTRPTPGVLRFRMEPHDVVLCIAELCRDSHYMSRDTAAVLPTVLVTLEPSSTTLPEPWLSRTSLARIVAGEHNLVALLREAADQVPASTRTSASVPIYTAGVRPVMPHPPPVHIAARQFRLEVTEHEARVEGIVVADHAAHKQLLVLQILWEKHVEWLAKMTSATPRLLRLKDLADEVEKRARVERPGINTVRRNVNRLQLTIQQRIRRELGLPIGREDIIKTVRWRGEDKEYGYLINHERVLPVPPASIRS